jgi:hypothetical protein
VLTASQVREADSREGVDHECGGRANPDERRHEVGPIETITSDADRERVGHRERPPHE